MGVSGVMELIRRLSPAYRKACEIEKAVQLSCDRQRESLNELVRKVESAYAEMADRMEALSETQLQKTEAAVAALHAFEAEKAAGLAQALSGLSTKLEQTGAALGAKTGSVLEAMQDDLAEMFDLQAGKLAELGRCLEKSLDAKSRQTDAVLHDELAATSSNLSRKLDQVGNGLAKGLSDKTDGLGNVLHDALAATSDNLAHKVDEVCTTVRGELSAASGVMRQRMGELAAQSLAAIRESCDTLFRNDIRCRWQVIDAVDQVLFPPQTKVRCRICGHEAPRSAYETRVTECIFGGGRLERYVCPDCGAIFGPLKMMTLSESQLGAEYRQSYSVYRESDCTKLEKLAFEALKPQKGGVYLNYGAGAWNKTTKELRAQGYEVYDYEPYAPAAENPWLIRSFDELKKRKFDGIFSNDVIEHLMDPIRDLRAMRDLLRPQGAMAHCSGCYEYAFEYTRFHLVFFTGDSINRVAHAAGLACELGERLFPYSPARLCTFVPNETRKGK